MIRTAQVFINTGLFIVLGLCYLHFSGNVPLVEWEVEAGGYTQRFDKVGQCEFVWKAANMVMDVEPCKLVPHSVFDMWRG